MECERGLVGKEGSDVPFAGTAACPMACEMALHEETIYLVPRSLLHSVGS